MHTGTCGKTPHSVTILHNHKHGATEYSVVICLHSKGSHQFGSYSPLFLSSVNIKCVLEPIQCFWEETFFFLAGHDKFQVFIQCVCAWFGHTNYRIRVSKKANRYFLNVTERGDSV